MRSRALVLLAIVGLSTMTFAVERIPKPPIFSSMSCPLQCCPYGTNWTAHERLHAYKSPTDTAQQFAVEENEVIIAKTGLVITRMLGETKVLQTTRLGARLEPTASPRESVVTLEPGTTLYILQPQGKNCDKFWYKGKIYAAEIAPGVEGKAFAPGNPMLEIISRPKIDWWVQIQNSQGQSGWVKNPYSLFINADCEKDA